MSDPATRDMVVLGVITSEHGIKGQVKVKSFTENPFDLAAYGPLYAGDDGKQLEIIDMQPQGGLLVVKFAGVERREAAELLKGLELKVARDVLPEPEAQEFYFSDLAGLAVKRNGKVVGKVLEVVNFGAGDLLDIKFEGRKTSQFIAFNEEAVPVVDIKGGFVEVVPPDWMFEE